MSEQPVGAAMWGGMQLPSEQPRRPRAVPDQQPADEPVTPAARVPWADVVSVLLLLVAAVLIPTGAALEWGVGGGLLAGGAVAAALGVLLAFAGSDA